MLHNAYARSNGINHPAPSTYASSHQQPNGPAQQPNGYRPPAPSYLQSAPKGVTASPMEPSMSPQQQQIHRNQPAASYNPHQNGFARQRPPSSSLSAAMTPSNSQQARPFHEGQARTYAPSYGAPQSFSDTTPYTNGHMPNMASSPTPSLSATQGQTSVRFSPSGHNTSANGPAYVPNNNQPAPAAYSPMKHASPPAAHVRNFSNSNGQPLGNSQTPATVDPAQKSHSPVVGPHAPTLQSSSPKAPAAGISPVKHDLPPSSPPNSISRDVDIPRPDIPDSSGTLSNLPPTKQHPSSSPLPPALGIPSLQSVPALKPNVGTENQQGKALQPPVKRT